MYQNKSIEASRTGGLSVAVPGELAGLEYAWRMHGSGKVSWKDLVMPSAVLARNFTVPALLAKWIDVRSSVPSPLLDALPHTRCAFGSRPDTPIGSTAVGVADCQQTPEIVSDPGLRSVYAPDGVRKKQNDTASNPRLAETLERVVRLPCLALDSCMASRSALFAHARAFVFIVIIAQAEGGASAFYSRNSSLAQQLVADIKRAGGIITADDLHNYLHNATVKVRRPVKGFYRGLEVLRYLTRLQEP
jgi:gamma-glutamyltranspeptidase